MRRARELLALAAAALLIGCGAQEEGSTTERGAPASSEIRVGLTEWSIHTGGAVAAPGEVELVVTNAGGTGHDLVVEGDLGRWRTPVIEPGGRETVAVEAAPGESLSLTCSLPGHHESGMHTTLPVDASRAGK